MSADPLDEVLDLEARFYSQGYAQGLEDGAQAGRIEGRALGMEKGYDKFLEAGRLAGMAVVWANRLPPPPSQARADGRDACALPRLPANARLRKNVGALYAFVEPETLSTTNTDEAVQDFDDRVRRAQGKLRVVERMAGASAAREYAKEASPGPGTS